MIKIEDKIWAVIHIDRAPLSYMCQVTCKTDGSPDSATQKKQATGRSWARSHKGNTEAYYDNVPTKGVVIGDSVSRWMTDNKLFRVLDPRGFEVEVPTGNIAALLKYCTVVNGVIQEECVWGRDGGSHLLLPINSEPYIEAKKVIKKVETQTLKASDLQIGDRVKLLHYGEVGTDEYEFFGIVKLTWSRVTSKNKYRRDGLSYHGSYNKLVESIPFGTEEIQDDKWVAVFGRKVNTWDHTKPYGPQRDATQRLVWNFTYELNPKIMERKAGVPSEPLTVEIMGDRSYQYPPERVAKRFEHKSEDRYTSVEWRIVCKNHIADVQFKPQKS